MKQRTRLMHSGDDLITNVSLMDSKEVHSEVQLYRIKPQDHFIEAQVQEGDTLQAIALRFHCSISELKRINHIHKDNEIFARRTIKVPVTPYSVLTELVPAKLAPEEPVPSTSSQTSTSLSMQNMLQNPVENKLLQQNNTKSKLVTKDDDFAIDCNAVVLNSTLTPAVVPYTDEQNEIVSENARLLPNKPKVPVEAVVVKQLTSQGADFGLKWYHLVFCLLVLGVVTPLLYIMFYVDKHTHPDSTN